MKDIRTLEVHFKVMGSLNKAKPYGYNGAVVYYCVLGALPVEPSALTQSLLAGYEDALYAGFHGGRTRQACLYRIGLAEREGTFIP